MAAGLQESRVSDSHSTALPLDIVPAVRMFSPTVRVYFTSIVISLCMMQTGYAHSCFSSIQIFSSWTQYFQHPNAGKVGAANTAYSLGAVLAGIFVSPVISDRYGRRYPIGLSASFVIIGGLVSTFGTNIGTFIGGRALSGLGEGLGLPAGSVYLGEMTPAKTRGRHLSLWQIFYGVGAKVAQYVALACAFSPQLGIWQWRVVVLSQLAAPIILLCTLPFCPETPRWYIEKGRLDDARASLNKLRAPSEVSFELFEIQSASTMQKRWKGLRWKVILANRSYRDRLLLAAIMNAAQQLTGIVVLGSYGAVILNAVFHSTTTVTLVNAITAIPITLCPIIALFLIDVWGRRAMLIWGTALQAVVMLLMALVVTRTPGAGATYDMGVGVGVVILIFAFHVGYGPSWGASLWTWTVEIFPMPIRAKAVAFSVQMQNVAGIALGQAFPSLFKAAGYNAFYFFFGSNVLIFAFVYLFVKETKSLPLDCIDAVFDGVDHDHVRQGRVERWS